MAQKRLIINAVDFGLSEKINQGIFKGIEERVVTSVSVMIKRQHLDKELLAKNVAIGLHAELTEGEDTRQELKNQIEKFEKIFGRLPAYLDGHEHCQTEAERINDFLAVAKEYNLPVGSWKKEDREIIKLAEIKTPREFISWHPKRKEKMIESIKKLPAGVSEIVVRPGYYDQNSDLGYNRQREDELNIIGSEEFKKLLKENEITLVSYSSLSK